MKKELNDFFKKENIEYFGALPLKECTVINPSLLERKIPDAASALIYTVPYFTGNYPDRNISLYAIPKDYHLFFKELNMRLAKMLYNLFPGCNFIGFADSSPINEVEAAAKCSLGTVGDNGLIITGEYGSYVFIGEILSDMPFEDYFDGNAPETSRIMSCSHCGRCKSACPAPNGSCLSGITQKKGTLSPQEEGAIQHGLAWGCDTCQTVCPMNRDAKTTPIEFFGNDLISFLTSDIISGMSDDEFSQRAYAWKGRATIGRNLILTESSIKADK